MHIRDLSNPAARRLWWGAGAPGRTGARWRRGKVGTALPWTSKVPRRVWRRSESLRPEVTRPDELGLLEISVTPPAGVVQTDDLRAFADLGVDRLIALPGSLGKEAGIDGYLRFIDDLAGQASKL